MKLLYLLAIIGQFSITPKFDPNLKWQKLSSEHFNVYFSNQYDLELTTQIAQRVLWHCEEAYKKLTPFMGYAPKGKTNVIIGDFYDYPAGWATPFPHNTIFINLAFPKELKVRYRNWLTHLITHEYTHVLTMDMALGLNKYLRKVFGRIIIPNTILPLFLTEGYAVYNETKFTKNGRLNSSYYQMMMRANVLGNKILPIDKWVTYELAEFPAGETPYLYGALFLEYLAYKYGEQKLPKLVQNHSKGLPLFFNCRAKRLWQKSFFKLWREFKDQTINEYQSQIAELQSKPVTQSQKITDFGYYTSSPICAPDGQKIYFVTSTGDAQTTLWELDRKTNKSRPLLKANISSRLSISPDGSKILFCIRDYYKNFYYFDDLYLWELSSRKLIRLTHGMRAADPGFLTDNKVVFIKNELEESSINMFDLRSGTITTILETYTTEKYLNICPSPDNKKIAITIWKLGDAVDLYVYDLDTEWLLPVTNNGALELDPRWSSDNNYLFFTSDLNEVFNIYAYDIKTETLYQITNVLTGAFAPCPSPNGQELIFLLYSHKGYDIHCTKINYADLMPALISSKDSFQIEAIEAKDTLYSVDTIYATLGNYCPIPSLLPKFWAPLATYDKTNKWSYGVLTYGSDIFYKHQYLLYALYKNPINKSLVHFEYFVNLFPEINLALNYYNKNYSLRINTNFTFLKNNYSQYLTFGYQYDKKNIKVGTVNLSYAFNNTHIYRYSISPEDGRILGMGLKSRNKLLKSDITQTQLVAYYTEFLNLPVKHQVFVSQLRLACLWGESTYPYGNSEVIKIRGVSDTFNMRYGLNLILEYRFPVIWIERSIGISPLFFKNVSAKLFLDIGCESNSLGNLIQAGSIIKGVGGELNLRTIWFYEVPINTAIGAACDLSRRQIGEYYVKLVSDLEAIWGNSKNFITHY